MKNLITELLSSKKFIATLLGVSVTLLCHYLGIDPQTTLQSGGVIAAYIIGQGIADHGSANQPK